MASTISASASAPRSSSGVVVPMPLVTMPKRSFSSADAPSARLRSVWARDRHVGAARRGDRRRDASDCAGSAENQHALAAQLHAMLLAQMPLDQRDQRGRGRVRTARIGEYGDLEWRDHRLARGVEHVDGLHHVAPADEDAGARHPFRAAREDRVLREVRDHAGLDVAIRHDDLVAGIGGHVDVERTHLRRGREHVQDVGPFNGF
ncbi:hypothetical protein OKW47_006465 [Paraburkholderia atlantica]